MEKKKILMVCEAFGGGVFTYVSQLCNDMVDDFEVYLAYSLRPQTPKNYKEFLNQKVHLIKSVIHNRINGYVCDTAEEYAKRIKDAMREFPKGLPEQAYQDVLRIYNTCAMKKKYIAFYTQITGGGGL